MDLVMGQATSFVSHVNALLASIAGGIVAPLRASDLRRHSARLGTQDDEGAAMLASEALAAARCAQEMYRCGDGGAVPAACFARGC